MNKGAQMELKNIKAGQTFAHKYGNKDYEADVFFALKVTNRGGMVHIQAKAPTGWILKLKVPA